MEKFSFRSTGIGVSGDAQNENDPALLGVAGTPSNFVSAEVQAPQPSQPLAGGPKPSLGNPLPVTPRSPKSRWRHVSGWIAALTAVVVLLGGLFYLFFSQSKQRDLLTSHDAGDQYGTTQLPLNDLAQKGGLLATEDRRLTINAQVRIDDGLVLAPTLQPSSATAGQIYFDQTSNQLAYFNGNKFVPLGAGVQSLGGAAGAIGLGGGLSLVGGGITNTGVLTVQGLSGAINFTAGNGIALNGTTISNTGVTSVGGLTGGVGLGNGLTVAGGVLNNSGVISLSPGSANLTISNDGNGNLTISDNSIAGTGTVTSGGGTAGRIAKFTSAQNIENSLLSEAGTVVTVNGDLSVTGNLSLGSALSVANGGTGAAALATNGVLIGNGTNAISSVTAGGAGLCLMSNAGVPSFQACPGSGGVTSLNGLTGPITIANASGSGSTVTINDASTAQKGIAQFDATNFTAASGVINTIQNIHTSASPTFVNLNLSGAISGGTTYSGSGNINTTGGSLQTAGITRVDNGGNLTNVGSLTATGAITIASTGAGNDIILNSTDTIELQDNTNVTGNLTSTGNATLQGGSVTIGTTSQAASLLLHDGNGQTTTLRAGDSSSNLTFILPTNAGAANQCLKQSGAGDQLIWDACDGGGGGSTATMQQAYNNGSTITTTDARNVAITLADTTTDSDLTITTATGSTGTTSIVRADGAGAADPSQLLLLDNLDADRAQPVGLRLQAAGGGMTTAIDASDVEIGTALSFGANDINGTSFSVTGSNGNVTTAGDVAVNGGDITSSGALNITPGGALVVGATGQTVTLQGSVTTLSSTGAGNDIILNSADIIDLQDSTTITGAFTQAGGAISLTGNGSSSISTTSGTLTLQSATNANQVVLGSSNTINLNTAASGTITVGGSNTATVNIGGLTNNGRTVNVGVGTGGTQTQTVNLGSQGGASATTVNSGTGGTGINSNGSIVAKSLTNSTTAFQVQNAASATILNVDSTNARVGINGTPRSDLDIANDGGQLTIGGSTVGGAITFGSSAVANALHFANNAFNFYTTQNNGFMWYTDYDLDTGTPEMILSALGAASFRNNTDSTAGFKVQNAGGTNQLTVDTTNSRVYVGPTAGDTTGSLLVLGNKTNSGDPTGVNGSMYYNASSGRFRCHESGSWQNCLSRNDYTPAYIGNNNMDPNSAANVGSANRAWFIAVTVPVPVVVTGVRMAIGASSGNIDVGLYDNSGTRLASSGSTACPSSGFATVNFTTSATIQPGIYYLSLAADNTSATFTRSGINGVVGVNYFNSSFPLPSSVTLPGTSDASGNSRPFALAGLVSGGITQ